MMNNDARDALVHERYTVLHDPGRYGDGEKGRENELARLDGDIKSMCPHDSIYWDSRSAEDGRIITTCERCDVSWYEHVG